MARGARRRLAALPLLPAWALARGCLEEGAAYEGRQAIAPGYASTAAGCRLQCAMTLSCAYFTWRAAPDRSLGLIGGGGCLKFDAGAALVPARGPLAETVSGPRACPASSPSLVPRATDLASMHSVSSLPPELPTGTPTLGPVTVSAMASEASARNGTGGVARGENGGGSFLSWVEWFFGLLVVQRLLEYLLMGIGVVVVVACQRLSGEKEEDDTEAQDDTEARKRTPRKQAEDDTEAQALLRTEAPPLTAALAARQTAAPLP